jgi:3-hydroxyisobutyrate dehydrogenase-like beta-hydroxyacid dehydrogenase
MNARPTVTVGVLGLGAIGGGVARSLARAGYMVIAHDVNGDLLERLADIVVRAGSAREVADRSAVVLVAVFDDEQVRSVLEGPDGVLASTSKPSDVVILSTVTIETVRAAVAACARHGVAVLDCGVTGGPQALQHDAIVSMVGGDDSAVERVRTVLEAFSRPVVHTGPTGTGMQAKLARNLLYFAGAHVAWEAARLAEAAGVTVEKLIEISDTSDRWTGGATAILKRGFTPGTRPMSSEDRDRRERMAGYAHKDLAAALSLGRSLGVELPAATVALQHFDEVVGLTISRRDSGPRESET